MRFSVFGGLKFLNSIFLLAGVDFHGAFAVGIHFDITAFIHGYGFKLSALWCWNNDQRFGLIRLVHSLANVEAVLKCDVVVLPHILILQKVRLNLFVQLFYALVQLFLFLCKLVIFSFELVDIFLDFRWLIATDPLYCVLLKFLHVIYPLQYISNVVNSSLLHVQLGYSLIEVNRVVLALLNQLDELFRKYR